MSENVDSADHKERREQEENRADLDSVEFQDHADHLVTQDHQALMEKMVHEDRPVKMASQDRQEQPVAEEYQDHKVLLALREIVDRQAEQEIPGLMVQQEKKARPDRLVIRAPRDQEEETEIAVSPVSKEPEDQLD